MKLEDKDLLLKDLCARFPYGVKVEIIENFQSGVYTLDPSCINKIIYGFADIKPYLRPMSSMTEEEREEYEKTLEIEYQDVLPGPIYHKTLDSYYYLLEHHFDFQGLITADSAIGVTEVDNPYKD